MGVTNGERIRLWRRMRFLPLLLSMFGRRSGKQMFSHESKFLLGMQAKMRCQIAKELVLEYKMLMIATPSVIVSWRLCCMHSRISPYCAAFETGTLTINMAMARLG